MGHKIVVDRARTAIEKMRGERYSLKSINDSLRAEYGLDYSLSTLSRINSGERECSEALEIALVKLCKLLTGEKV